MNSRLGGFWGSNPWIISRTDRTPQYNLVNVWWYGRYKRPQSTRNNTSSRQQLKRWKKHLIAFTMRFDWSAAFQRREKISNRSIVSVPALRIRRLSGGSWRVNTILFWNIRWCHDIASIYVISILFRLYYVDGYHRMRFVWQIQSCGRFYYMLHSASSVCVNPKEKTSRLKYIVKCYVLR